MNTEYFQVYETTCHWIEKALIDRAYTQSNTWKLLKADTKTKVEEAKGVKVDKL